MLGKMTPPEEEEEEEGDERGYGTRRRADSASSVEEGETDTVSGWVRMGRGPGGRGILETIAE